MCLGRSVNRSEGSHTTLHQKVKEGSAGEVISDYVEAPSLETGARWYISCDGCYTNSLVGWQEVKVGSLCKDYPNTNATSVVKVGPPSLRYVAARESAADFGRQLAALSRKTGIYQNAATLETQEVVVIGDGAAWIWNLAEEHFPGSTEIVDDMHAKSDLAERCKLAGMRWTKPGIDAILFWRCLLKNDAWNTYWDTQYSLIA